MEDINPKQFWGCIGLMAGVLLLGIWWRADGSGQFMSMAVALVIAIGAWLFSLGALTNDSCLDKVWGCGCSLLTAAPLTFAVALFIWTGDFRRSEELIDGVESLWSGAKSPTPDTTSATAASTPTYTASPIADAQPTAPTLQPTATPTELPAPTPIPTATEPTEVPTPTSVPTAKVPTKVTLPTVEPDAIVLDGPAPRSGSIPADREVFDLLSDAIDRGADKLEYQASDLDGRAIVIMAAIFERISDPETPARNRLLGLQTHRAFALGVVGAGSGTAKVVVGESAGVTGAAVISTTVGAPVAATAATSTSALTPDATITYDIEIPFWIKGEDTAGQFEKRRRTLSVQVSALPDGWSPRLVDYAVRDDGPLSFRDQLAVWVWQVVVGSILVYAAAFCLLYLGPDTWRRPLCSIVTVVFVAYGSYALFGSWWAVVPGVIVYSVIANVTRALLSRTFRR